MKEKTEAAAQADTTVKHAKRGRPPKVKAAKADQNPPVQATGSRHRYRDPEARRALNIRLNRIEGQIKGIRHMLDEDVYCPDILVQVASVTAALNGFSKEILDEHIRTCVTEDIRNGKDETIDELLHVLQKILM